MNKQISAKDLELLSSFLDHQLSPSEQKSIESRLPSEKDLQNALSGLRRTKLILKALPLKAVPRDFTNSPQAKKNRFDLFQYFRVFRFSSAAAVMGLIVLLLMDFILPALKISSISGDRAVLAPAAAAPSDNVLKEPMIITWTTPQPFASGRGGGGADSPAGTIVVEVTPQPLETPALLESAKKAPPESLPIPQPQSEMQDAGSPVTSTGPILGIPPTSERGVLPTPPQSPAANGITNLNLLRILEIIFALLAFSSILIAVLLHRKMR